MRNAIGDHLHLIYPQEARRNAGSSGGNEEFKDDHYDDHNDDHDGGDDDHAHGDRGGYRCESTPTFALLHDLGIYICMCISICA
jgi:ABC-type Zn2+ transport system substrate-binding protein/surface adhesin